MHTFCKLRIKNESGSFSDLYTGLSHPFASHAHPHVQLVQRDTPRGPSFLRTARGCERCNPSLAVQRHDTIMPEEGTMQARYTGD